MIVKFTEGPDRHRLGFAEAVGREFAFLEATFGFHKVKHSATFVRYESERLFLNVFHGRGSYEIGVELGRLSNPEVHYRLASLVAGLAPGHRGPTVFQASSRQGVEGSVTEVALILRVHCAAALAGDAEALRLVEQAAKGESERATLSAQFGAILDRADQAWEAKDLRLAASLYEQARPALDETRSRRLDYLLGRKESAVE
jgi:hypothetical protein